MYLQTLLIGFLLSFAYAQDRKITSVLNPDCETCTDPETTLVYVRADGSQDSIHQIWDFTRGMPTIIYAISTLKSKMEVSWDANKPIKFKMTGGPVYSFAATIDKLIEYDDIEDNGHIDGRCPQRSLSMRYMSWTRNDSVLNNSMEAMLRMHGKYSDHWRQGVVDMKLDLLPFKDFAVDLPHLIHTANSTLVDVSLVNMTISDDYNASRFAIHFVLTSTDGKKNSMNYTMRKSLDDEHTPGVFEIIEIETPKSARSEDGGFMQFRPVGYTEAERSVSSSTNAYISNFNWTTIPKGNTLRVFYQDTDDSQLLIQDMAISFGLPGDGYYKQHNYTSWSFTIGYGAPPLESFSLFVVIIISIGLGVPVVLALSGIIYVLVRRYKQRNAPTRFSDEE